MTLYRTSVVALTIVVSVLLVIAAPLPARAHLGENGTEVYDVTVSATGISLVDDGNWIGGADVILGTEVDPTNPEHDSVERMTDDPVAVASGESKTFSPVPIYEHQTCGCDQTFAIDIDALDYSPIWSATEEILVIGSDKFIAYLIGGPLGAGISVIGDVIDWISGQIQLAGLSDEEKAAFARAVIRDQSEHLGTANDEPSTGCEQLTETFTAPLLLEERENGTVTYEVKKVATGESCGATEETGANTTPPVNEPARPEEEPGTTPPPAPPEEEEEKPACQVETGKVLLNDEYVCPTSSVEEGGGCLCIEGYEWVSPADHCQGCTRTNVEKCLAAVRASIDQATGTLEPDLRVEGSRIIWDGGESSCKAQASVIADFSDLLREYTPQNTAECTNLEFLAGYEHPTLACGIEFSFRYAQE